MSSTPLRPDHETFENLRLELRRGAVVIAVLARLRTEQYGYGLRKALLERGMDIEENTLYPLLRRLEAQGLLESEWREEDKRNKRFYRLAAEGQIILGRLLEERSDIEASLDRIVEENANDQPDRSLSPFGKGAAATRPAGRHHRRALGELARPDG